MFRATPAAKGGFGEKPQYNTNPQIATSSSLRYRFPKRKQPTGDVK
ncbi:hypothetical protein HOY34_16305 [Xinfangfangia sp. D13-10-4-6]|nr:hypothetical protein [Pseudogemmobacter hezensis]NPD16755.1 hypothetical protein [Pseudogemmobacter hezensis]